MRNDIPKPTFIHPPFDRLPDILARPLEVYVHSIAEDYVVRNGGGMRIFDQGDGTVPVEFYDDVTALLNHLAELLCDRYKIHTYDQLPPHLLARFAQASSPLLFPDSFPIANGRDFAAKEISYRHAVDRMFNDYQSYLRFINDIPAMFPFGVDIESFIKSSYDPVPDEMGSDIDWHTYLGLDRD